MAAAWDTVMLVRRLLGTPGQKEAYTFTRNVELQRRNLAGVPGNGEGGGRRT
jgi:hypothetical protein